MVGRTVSHYRVLEKLGEGGMGVVYKAEDARLNRLVALKFLSPAAVGDPEQRRRLLREAQAAAALDHPNICTIYGVEEIDDQIFIAMALAEGVSVRDRVLSGPLSLSEAWHIAAQVAKGLEAAHEKGVIHRDIKSANVMVTPRGHARILDFGLALVGVPGGSSAPTAILGTPAYMSPEQIQAQPLDARTDIWSWGVVFYEMLTGQLPFAGENVVKMATAITKAAPTPPSTLNHTVPPSWDRIVLKALAKRADARFASASDLIAVLDQPSEQVTVSTPLRLAVSFRSLPSIAVLPFADMSVARDQGYFCEGIAEEIITGLTQLHGLRVVSRTSSFAFRDTREDVREIGRRLGVEAVLEGAVRKAGERLRVSAQLIDTTDGYHLWSERYDRELRDVFAIQEEIATKIVQALRVELSEKERQALAKVATRDVEAYDLYLRGLQFFYRSRQRDLRFALEMFARASEVDPTFARAYAGTSFCHAFLFCYYGAHRENLEEALATSVKALEADPQLAEAHAAHGFALSLDKQYNAAEAEFEVAIGLNELLYEAYYFYARFRVAQGRLGDAARLFARAAEVNREEYQAASLRAFVLRMVGRVDEAAEAYQSALDRCQRHVSLNPDDARALYMLGQVLVESGRKDEGVRSARKAVSLASGDPYILYGMVCVLARVGEIDEALRYFEQAVNRGFVQREWIENDADLDPLRKHPAYQAIMADLP